MFCPISSAKLTLQEATARTTGKRIEAASDIELFILFLYLTF